MKAFLREWRLLLISSPLSFIHFLFPFCIILMRILSGKIVVDSPITLLLFQSGLIILVQIFNGFSFFPLRGSAGFYRELGRGESDFTLILSKVSASCFFSLLLFLPCLPEVFYVAHLYRFDLGIVTWGIVLIIGGLLILNLVWSGILLCLTRFNMQIIAGLLLGVMAEVFLFIRSWESPLLNLPRVFFFFGIVSFIFFVDYLVLRKIRKNRFFLRRIDNIRILLPLAVLFFIGSFFTSGKQIDITLNHISSPSSVLINNLKKLDDPLYLYLPEQNHSIQYFLTLMMKQCGGEIILNRLDDKGQAGIRYRNQFFPLAEDDIEIRLENSINRVVDFVANQREMLNVYVLYRDEEEKEDPWINQFFLKYDPIYQWHWTQQIPETSGAKDLILIRNSDSLSGDEIAGLYYWQQSGGSLIMLMNGLSVDPVNLGRAESKVNQDRDQLVNQLWGVRPLPTLIRETALRSGKAVSINENRLLTYPFWWTPTEEPFSGFQAQTRESRLLWVSPLEIDADWQDEWIILQQSSFESDTVQKTSFSLAPGGEIAAASVIPGGQVPYVCWLPGEAGKGELVVWGTPWSFSSYADVAGGRDNGYLLISTIDLIAGNSSASLPDKYIRTMIPRETPDPFRYLILLFLLNTLLFAMGRLYRRFV